MFTKNLSKSFDFWMEKIIYEWMHVCMIMLKKHRQHGEVKSNMMEPRVTTPFGEDYGLNLLL